MRLPRCENCLSQTRHECGFGFTVSLSPPLPSTIRTSHSSPPSDLCLGPFFLWQQNLLPFHCICFTTFSQLFHWCCIVHDKHSICHDDVSDKIMTTRLSSQSFRFSGHLPGEPELAGFIEAKDDGNGGDTGSCKSCTAPVK